MRLVLSMGVVVDGVVKHVSSIVIFSTTKNNGSSQKDALIYTEIYDGDIYIYIIKIMNFLLTILNEDWFIPIIKLLL